MVRASLSQSVDLGFIPLVESYQKKTLKMVSTASLLGTRHFGQIVKNKPASLLVVSLGKALNGTLHLYVKDRWPRHLGNGNTQARADKPSKVKRYNSFSRQWRINMVNKIKKVNKKNNSEVELQLNWKWSCVLQ